ncbi:MAG: beta strand repeat-containing protein [Candidatus Spyradenecus sp.]
MRAFTRSLGVCSAAFLLAASARADVTGTFCTTFNGNLTVTRSEDSTWVSSWSDWDLPNDSSWFRSAKTKAMQTTASVHPCIEGSNAQLPQSFTLMLYADISQVAGSESARAAMVCAGSVNGQNSVILAKTGTNTVAVLSNETTLSELTITDASLAAGYHLFIIINDATNGKATLIVDSTKQEYTTAALTQPAAGIQVGAPFGGASYFENGATAANMLVDELRCYASVLTDAEVRALQDEFPVAVVVDASKSAVTVTDADKTAYAAYNGPITFIGSGTNGVTLEYAKDTTVTFSPRLLFEGGKHTFKFGRDSATAVFATGQGDELPTIDVTNSTTLDFYLKDLSGWGGTVTANPAVIRVRDGGTLNIKDYDNGSGFFRDRLVLDGGASVTMDGTQFILHGGTQEADHAQIAMLDATAENPTEATLAGQIGITNINGGQAQGSKESTIAVGANATLKASAKFVGQAEGGKLTKVGTGTLELSSSETNTSNPLVVSAGKVVFTEGATWGTGKVEVQAGASVEAKTGTDGEVTLAELAGSGTVTVTGTGVLHFNYSSVAGERPTVSVPAGAKVKIHVTYADVANDLTVSNVSLAEDENATFVLPSGREVEGTGNALAAMTIFQWAPTSDSSWETLANWTKNGAEATELPTAEDTVSIALSADTTLTLGADAKAKEMEIRGGNLTLAGGTLTVGGVTADTGKTLTVASGAGLTLVGPAEVANKVTVVAGGTLTTQGDVTLASDANVFSGTLMVESGIASVNAADRSLSGTVEVKAGATLKNLRGNDALNYSATAESPVAVNLYGTLDMGSTRWSIGQYNTLNLYAGCEVTGSGEGSNGALDWFSTSSVNVLAKDAADTVTLSANLRTRGTPSFSVAEGMTLIFTGPVNGAGNVTLASGKVKYLAATTYSGTTTVKAGATLALDKANTLDDGTAADRSFANGHNLVLEEGSALVLANGAGYYNITGSGDVSVTGTYYLGFSASDGNANANTKDYGKLSAASLTVAGNFYTRGFNTNWTPVANRAIQVGELAVTGSIGRDGGDADVISLSVATKVSGTGTIDIPLTLADGATLDASAGALTAATVTIADGATVAVTLPESPAAGTEVLKCSNPAEVAAKLEATLSTGYELAANKGGTAVVVALTIPAVSEGTGSVALSEASQALLQAVASAKNMTSVTAVSGSTTVNGEEKTLTAEQIDNALAVFGDSVVTAAGTTLKVDYNFGIVSVSPYIYGGTITSFIVTVKAERVGGATPTAMDLATGFELKLVDSAKDTVINATGDFSYSAATGLHTGYFTPDTTSADCLIGRSFKVRAQPVPATTE